MDAPALIARLERFPEALEAAVAGLGGADWRWSPAAAAWSIGDVLVHLVSEETDDFRERLRRTLEDPSLPWPPLDPQAVVAAARGSSPGPAELLRRFREERRASVAWLRGLAAPRWENVHAHPAGPLRAGDLLASWAAHDARHLAQVARLLHGLAARDGVPYSGAYAG